MEGKEPKYIIPESNLNIKKDGPSKETKYKLNLATMKIEKEEEKENE